MAGDQKEQHFVKFLSPGIFVTERTIKPIDEWDISVAVDMVPSVVERYGARPYGFHFSTYAQVAGNLLRVKEVGRSGIYFLGGKVRTLEDVRADYEAGDRDLKILLANMEGNRWDRVITTTQGYLWTHPFLEEDTVLDLVTA